MAEAGAPGLLTLMAWLSPAFPVGSFSYSHGLERAVEDGQVRNGDELDEWLVALLGHGSAWNDAVLFAEAWRNGRSRMPPDEVAGLGLALAGSAERLLEGEKQGAAFAAAMRDWGGKIEIAADCPYCVAVGAHAGAAGIGLEPALAAFLLAFAGNQLQAGIRLGLLGQSQATRLLAGLQAEVVATAARAARSTLDDLGSATLAAEIAAMRHETQYSRLFRA